MSKRIKVRMQFSQTVWYDQEVEMTPEEFNTVKDYSDDSLNENHDKEPHTVIHGYTNFRDVCDGGDFDNVELTLIE